MASLVSAPRYSRAGATTGIMNIKTGRKKQYLEIPFLEERQRGKAALCSRRKKGKLDTIRIIASAIAKSRPTRKESIMVSKREKRRRASRSYQRTHAGFPVLSVDD